MIGLGVDDCTWGSVSRQCKQSKATTNGGPLSISSLSKHFEAQASMDGDWRVSFEESLRALSEQKISPKYRSTRLPRLVGDSVDLKSRSRREMHDGRVKYRSPVVRKGVCSDE